MTFTEKLWRLRKERKLTQAQAAAGCGMSLRGYQNYEHGEQEPSMSKLIVLADFYEISIDELVCREWPRSL